MKHQLWLGTELALTELAQCQKWASDNMIALMDRRQSFMGVDDVDSESAQMGDYLINHHGNGVASVSVKGSLTNAYEWWHPYVASKVTSYEAIGDALATLASDEEVSTILLDISSGGGSVMGLDNLTQKVRSVRQGKKVIAHTSTAAFSAAYWIAASANEVVTTRMAEVGSIGTLMVHQSMAQMAENMGIEFTVFRAGKYKALGLPYENLSDEAKEHIQADLDKANSFFLEHVSLRRNLHMSSRGLWAEGKTFFAEEGIDVGLVDRIATMDELVSASGAASTHQRRKPMFISEEKRAQIASGANPEDVLTAEELEQYNAELEDPQKSAEEPEDTTETGEGPSAGEDPEPEPQADVGFGEGITAQDYRQALKDAAKAEARAEAAEERVAEMEASLKSKDAQISSITEIGKQAVHNLQIALGKPKESPGSAEALVTMYHNLQTEMSERFSTGRKSKEPREQDDTVNIPLAFRHKPTQ